MFAEIQLPVEAEIAGGPNRNFELQYLNPVIFYRAIELDLYAVGRDPLTAARHGSLGYDYARSGRLDEHQA